MNRYDLDELYHDIGQAVVLFQVLENELWQLGVAALGHDQFDESRRSMSGHSFHQLCRKVREAVARRSHARGEDPTGLIERLDSALEDCDSLRRRRNSLMHSAYIFFEMSGELRGVMRSDISRAPEGGLMIEQEDLDPSSFGSFHGDLVEACWQLMQLRLQVVAWPS